MNVSNNDYISMNNNYKKLLNYNITAKTNNTLASRLNRIDNGNQNTLLLNRDERDKHGLINNSMFKDKIISNGNSLGFRRKKISDEKFLTSLFYNNYSNNSASLEYRLLKHHSNNINNKELTKNSNSISNITNSFKYNKNESYNKANDLMGLIKLEVEKENREVMDVIHEELHQIKKQLSILPDNLVINVDKTNNNSSNMNNLINSNTLNSINRLSNNFIDKNKVRFNHLTQPYHISKHKYNSSDFNADRYINENNPHKLRQNYSMLDNIAFNEPKENVFARKMYFNKLKNVFDLEKDNYYAYEFDNSFHNISYKRKIHRKLNIFKACSVILIYYHILKRAGRVKFYNDTSKKESQKRYFYDRLDIVKLLANYQEEFFSTMYNYYKNDLYTEAFKNKSFNDKRIVELLQALVKGFVLSIKDKDFTDKISELLHYYVDSAVQGNYVSDLKRKKINKNTLYNPNSNVSDNADKKKSSRISKSKVTLYNDKASRFEREENYLKQFKHNYNQNDKDKSDEEESINSDKEQDELNFISNYNLNYNSSKINDITKTKLYAKDFFYLFEIERLHFSFFGHLTNLLNNKLELSLLISMLVLVKSFVHVGCLGCKAFYDIRSKFTYKLQNKYDFLFDNYKLIGSLLVHIITQMFSDIPKAHNEVVSYLNFCHAYEKTVFDRERKRLCGVNRIQHINDIRYDLIKKDTLFSDLYNRSDLFEFFGRNTLFIEQMKFSLMIFVDEITNCALRGITIK